MSFVLHETRFPSGTVATIECRALSDAGFLNAFSTRSGGVSPFPKEALNLSFKDDHAPNVTENRRRFFAALRGSHHQKPVQEIALVTVRQTHSTDAFILESEAHAREQAIAIEKDPLKGGAAADAIVAPFKNLAVGIKTADCVPLLIADPKSRIVAAVHAGWRGTAGRITERTLASLKKKFGVRPQDCIAALGPAACGACYEVGEDVIRFFQKEFPDSGDYFSPVKYGKSFMDARRANMNQLRAAGLSDKNIHVSKFCTMHENHLFFSHRKEGTGKAFAGRLLSLIGA